MNIIIKPGDLLRHNLLDLYSAEEQLMTALPAIITKATDACLQNTLTQLLEHTKKQIEKLDIIKTVLKEGPQGATSCFSNLFGGSDKTVCKAVEAILQPAQMMMAEKMEDDTLDAFIIATVQKIVRYRTAVYATACSFAKHLDMASVSQLLAEMLKLELNTDNTLCRVQLRNLFIDRHI